MNELLQDGLSALGSPNTTRVELECERSEGPWHVRHSAIREALGRPYVIDATIVTENTELDTDRLVGATCELMLERTSDRRTFPGVIRRVHHRGVTTVHGSTPMLAIDLEIVAAVAMGGQRIACRIFQDQSVPEILREVLLGQRTQDGQPAQGLAAYDRTVSTDRLDPDRYEPPRDYCVQYKESDVMFATRLMHEEGIVYVFDHDDDGREMVVLIDDEQSLPELAGVDGPVPISATLSEGTECLRHFTFERAACPTRVAARHHDWLHPHQPVHHPGTVFSTGDIADNDREVYVPTEHRTTEIYRGNDLQSVHDDSRRRLELALERLMHEDLVGHGSSNLAQLGAGSVFEVDHGTELPRMVAVEVVHEVTTDGAIGSVARYDNYFVALPASRFRAGVAATPRPVMRGPQTATVSGPAPEEVHTDSHGRIQVRMHWDRTHEGSAGHTTSASSVWVRVVQAWAGAGWGFCFLPRVGMEVIVEFLDGNPDRPVVAGCLYNGANPPPYALPSERTKSTIKTSSSPGGQGFNELRFEDRSGGEEVFIHAQRDFNEITQRNHTTQVRADQFHSVGGSRRRTVQGDEQVTVEGNRQITVNGSGDGGFSGQSLKISSNYRLDVAEEIDVQAPVQIEIRCEGSVITMTPERIVLRAGGGAEITLDDDGVFQSSDGTRLQLDEDARLEASTGASLQMDENAALASSDGAHVELTEDALIHSSGDAHALFESSKASVTSGQAALQVDGGHAALDGDEVDVEGSSRVTLDGGGARTSLTGGNAGMN